MRGADEVDFAARSGFPYPLAGQQPRQEAASGSASHGSSFTRATTAPTMTPP